MLKKNNIAFGILAGLILPALMWLVFGILFKHNTLFFNKPAIPYMVAVALNLFAIKYFFKKDAGKTGAGMILSTFTCMLLVFLFQNYLR